VAEQTYLFIASVPTAGLQDFQLFIARVLPLIGEHGGWLERRFGSDDGTVELFVVSFPDTSAFDRLQTSTHISDAAPLLYRSGARFEVMPVAHKPIRDQVSSSDSGLDLTKAD
jgi:hypothetical protein